MADITDLYQPLLTAIKKHTRTLNNLNASIKFLREDIVLLYKEMAELKKEKPDV